MEALCLYSCDRQEDSLAMVSSDGQNKKAFTLPGSLALFPSRAVLLGDITLGYRGDIARRGGDITQSRGLMGIGSVSPFHPIDG